MKKMKLLSSLLLLNLPMIAVASSFDPGHRDLRKLITLDFKSDSRKLESNIELKMQKLLGKVHGCLLGHDKNRPDEVSSIKSSYILTPVKGDKDFKWFFPYFANVGGYDQICIGFTDESFDKFSCMCTRAVSQK